MDDLLLDIPQQPAMLLLRHSFSFTPYQKIQEDKIHKQNFK